MKQIFRFGGLNPIFGPRRQGLVTDFIAPFIYPSPKRVIYFSRLVVGL